MSRNFLIAFAVGVALIALAVAGIMVMQRGSAIQFQARILKARTAPLDENSTVAVLDIRLSNPSDLVLEVMQVRLEMEDAKGTRVYGDVIGASDTKRVFEAVPSLGQQFLETLSMKQRIPPRSTNDYMVAARFGAPVAEVDQRARFVLHLDESDGKTFEFLER